MGEAENTTTTTSRNTQTQEPLHFESKFITLIDSNQLTNSSSELRTVANQTTTTTTTEITTSQSGPTSSIILERSISNKLIVEIGEMDETNDVKLNLVEERRSNSANELRNHPKVASREVNSPFSVSQPQSEMYICR